MISSQIKFSELPRSKAFFVQSHLSFLPHTEEGELNKCSCCVEQLKKLNPFWIFFFNHLNIILCGFQFMLNLFL